MARLSSLATAALLLLAAAPALAGGSVALRCDGAEPQDFLVGTGRQFRGQGLELWPMVCLSTEKLGSYARVMDAPVFARLQKLAAQPAADKQTLSAWMTEHADDAALLVGPETFGRIEGLTFGDIRSTVQNAARPTEETILTSRFVYWIHPTCVGRLVPFDYYLETGAPCPACGGGKLKAGEKPPQPDWD